MTSKKAKLENLIGWRMRVVLNDGRNIIGRFMAFDRHMNLVLGEAEEFRLIKPKKGKKEDAREEKRHLGLIVLRGETLVTMTPEGAPPAKKEQKAGVAMMGSGHAVGRGTIAVPGTGLPVPPPPLPQHLIPGRGMPGIGRAPGMPAPMMPGMPGMPPMPGMIPPPGMMPGRGFPMPPMPPPGMPGFPGAPGMPPFPPAGMPPPSMGRGTPPPQ